MAAFDHEPGTEPSCPPPSAPSPRLATGYPVPSLSLPASVEPLGRVILGRHHETLPLARAPIHRLDDIDELVFAVNRKVDLVVIPRAEVDLNVFVPATPSVSLFHFRHVLPIAIPHLFSPFSFRGSCSPPEKHHSALVVDLVHDVEVGHLCVVDKVDGRKVLELVGDLVEVLVHGHDGGCTGFSEAEDYDAAFFAEDRLVDVPGREYGVSGRR